MPAIRKLPDSTTLRRLRSQGWRLKDIAETYDVTEAAVWKALERAGLTTPQPTVHDVIPWEIADQHKATAVMERFRSIVKQQKGAALRPEEELLLNRWLRDLKENNVVVAYHPDAPPNAASRKGGFYYVERLPEDDWIIRRPVDVHQN
jgi:hypothetical protein